MVTAAPRIDPLLLKILCWLDDPSRPIAETHRRLGAAADHLGLTRPSYQAVRRHIHEHRERTNTRPSRTDILLDVAFRSRPPEALLELLQ